MPKQVISITKSKMENAIQGYRGELASIRAGRANAGLFDKLTIEYYGAPTPINQMASIISA